MFCEYAALAYGDEIITWQPHPEFNSGFIEGLIDARRSVVPEDAVADAETRLNKKTSNAMIADHITAFFQKAR